MVVVGSSNRKCGQRDHPKSTIGTICNKVTATTIILMMLDIFPYYVWQTNTDTQAYRNATPSLLQTHARTQTHTHTFNGPLSGTTVPGWAGTRKVKPIWILLKRGTVSGSGISSAVCKSAPRSRQTTTPAPNHSVFTGRMPFLLPNQQHQSTEGYILWSCYKARVN